MAIPWITRIDPGSAWPIFFARVMEGALQAPIWPGTYSLVGKWIPAEEKPFLMSIISSGEDSMVGCPSREERERVDPKEYRCDTV